MKHRTKRAITISVATVLLLMASYGLLQTWADMRDQAHTNDATSRKRPRVVTGMDRGNMNGVFQMLNLTEDQRPKVNAILTSARARVSAIRNDAELSQKEKQAKMQTLMSQTLHDLHPILRPDQQQKLERLHQPTSGQHP